MTTIKSKATEVVGKAKKLFGKQVDAVVRQEEKVKELISNTFQKIANFGEDPRIKKLVAPIGVFIRMIKAHFNGAHKLTGSTLWLLVLGLVYFISPFDIVPDFLGFLGFADDLSVVLAIYAKVKDEVEEFLDWERTQE
ncbi:DUF1232 domain-containing protein [Algoriphagus sp.]|uniref:YkvA family protein n=1 Tax=Algoriphagus sp. TaxID=1872435 RepID=UPI0025DDA562|nr:DUF1232 domain-containing protein [Algoriphagus sp.]